MNLHPSDPNLQATEEDVTLSDPLLIGLIAKFSQAEACWYSSVRPDGRVHLAPIWHVWMQNHAYVVTQPSAIRAQNLLSNPSVSLALPDPMNPLILEGTAEFATEANDLLRPLFQVKYQWDIANDGEYSTIIRIRPSKLMAWGNHGSGRWRFNSQEQQWLRIA